MLFLLTTGVETDHDEIKAGMGTRHSIAVIAEEVWKIRPGIGFS